MPLATHYTPDLIVRLRAPDSTEATIFAEVKNRVEPRDVEKIARQLRTYSESGPWLLIAPYLNSRARDLINLQGISYVDLSGNTRVNISRPGLFITTEGTDNIHGPREYPLQSFKGPITGRIVRALCDFKPPLGIRDLAAKLSVSPSSVSKVASLAERESLLETDSTGKIVAVDWGGLLRRWASDYQPFVVGRTLKGSNAGLYVEPRGLAVLGQKLGASDLPYILSGSMGANEIVRVAPPKLAVCYTPSLNVFARQLGLTPSENGNVLVAIPFDRFVFERPWSTKPIQIAAPTQIVADLLVSPGRASEEADALIEWMKSDTDAWRI